MNDLNQFLRRPRPVVDYYIPDTESDDDDYFVPDWLQQSPPIVNRLPHRPRQKTPPPQPEPEIEEIDEEEYEAVSFQTFEHAINNMADDNTPAKHASLYEELADVEETQAVEVPKKTSRDIVANLTEAYAQDVQSTQSNCKKFGIDGRPASELRI
jgi:hypothetical protein